MRATSFATPVEVEVMMKLTDLLLSKPDISDDHSDVLAVVEGKWVVYESLDPHLLLQERDIMESTQDDDDEDALRRSANIETFMVGSVSFNMVRVAAGSFTMGATPEQQNPCLFEQPPFPVTLTHDFYLGETVVTQALWREVMDVNPSYNRGDSLPVDSVCWTDCQEFISRLNTRTGRLFRLPTVAEWEYAARGGSLSRGYQYAGGDNLNDVAWYACNSGKRPHPVKTKHPNELGLYDMSGNVCEWCHDMCGYYRGTPQTDPIGSADKPTHDMRGGSWFDQASLCRVSYGQSGGSSYSSNSLGLRLALSV